jgi:hypothetical protein
MFNVMIQIVRHYDAAGTVPPQQGQVKAENAVCPLVFEQRYMRVIVIYDADDETEDRASGDPEGIQHWRQRDNEWRRQKRG